MRTLSYVSRRRLRISSEHTLGDIRFWCYIFVLSQRALDMSTGDARERAASQMQPEPAYYGGASPGGL